MARVVISDSQFIVRHGLYDLLKNNHHQVIAETETKKQLQDALTNQVEVLVIDYNKVTGLSLSDVKKIGKSFPETHILAISDYQTKAEVLAAINAGILSFLTKDCDQREILDAVEATARGDKFFCNRVLDFILEGQIDGVKPNCNPSNLSDRELQIIQEMALGNKAKDIAQNLNLSIHTVYTHQKNIMKKIDVNSSTEIVLHAISHGLVTT